MKSRKLKAAAKSKAFMTKKQLKGSIPLDASDNESVIDSDEFLRDDIDDFHKREEDELLTDDELIQHQDQSSEEEEVLPITDDEKEDDSDEDFSEADKDLPNLEAWGKKKSLYYNADFIDEDRGRTYREEDAEAAKAEAEEAFAIQKSVYSNITNNRLETNLLFESSESSESENEENLTTASKEDKIKFLKRTSPEMFDFISLFKYSMTEIKDKLLPLLSLANEKKLPTEACAEYIKIKYQLLLHLSLNISFYMVLKSSGKRTNHHPVHQRISTYKKLLDQLKPIDETVTDQINIIVEKLKKNEEVIFKSSKSDEDNGKNSAVSESVPHEKINADVKIKNSKRKIDDTEAESEIISLISNIKEEMKRRKIEETERELQAALNDVKPMENQEEFTSDGKRTITYQIAKNKGLVPHRKKEYRNPRVKHRMKFRKANIRRKGQVREAVREIKKYQGEPTGISTHVVKSIKLK